MDAFGQQLSDMAEREYSSPEYREGLKQKAIKEAKSDMLKLKTMLLYLQDDDYACEINCGHVSVGLCDTKMMIPVINNEINEIEKFLRGEENIWE